MRQTGMGKIGALVAALSVSVALSGCTIPFVNIEVPIELPDFSSLHLPELPQIDFEKLGIKPITLPFGVQTTVEEARQNMLSGNTSILDDGALIEPGYLTVGLKTVNSSAPTCVEGEAGSVYGLDVDLAAVLASEMGLRVRYVPVVDTSSLGADCDVVMNGQSSDPNNIAVPGTYVESAISFFHRGDVEVVAPTDLGGKSVGIQSGSVSEAALNETGLKMSQKAYENLNEAFNALDAGEVDFVLCDAYPGAYLASLHDGISFAGALQKPETSGVAVLASNEALVSEIQTAFDAVSNNGLLEGVRTRWVGNMPPLTTDSQIQNIPASEKKEESSENQGDSESSDSEESSEEGSEEESYDEYGESDSEDGSDAGSIAITSV